MNNKKLFIVIGASVTFVAEVGMYISASVNGLIAFRLLQGIAVASWVCATVLFASYGLRAGFMVIGILGLAAPAITALLYDRAERMTLQEISEDKL